MQLELMWSPPRKRGQQAAQHCADKAEVLGFDVSAAQAFVRSRLETHGPQSGEDLVDAALAHGHQPHDGRAFGPVFAGLVRQRVIECAGYCERRKGHGTAGGRLWRLAGGVRP